MTHIYLTLFYTTAHASVDSHITSTIPVEAIVVAVVVAGTKMSAPMKLSGIHQKLFTV